MTELKNSFLELEIDPRGAGFNLTSTIDPRLFIKSSGVKVDYRRKKTQFSLPESGNKDYAVKLDEINDPRHGKVQTVELTRGFQSQNVMVKVTFGLPEEYPMLLWKVELRNLCCDPIRIHKFHLVNIYEGQDCGIGFGETDARKDPAFFSNGWQSWSYSATYGIKEPMRQSRLKAIQGQQWHNEGTPQPRKAGLYTSEFFGVVGDRNSRKGWLAGFLSQKQHFGSISADLRDQPVIQMWANGDAAQLDPEHSMETDWAVLIPIEIDERFPLDVFVDAVARENDVKLDKAKPTGWCSWYEFYTKIDDRKIQENLEAVKQLADTLPMNLFQIDDGYETQIGDWLTCKSTFSDGMKPHAEAAHAAGLTAGLWQAPLIVHKGSKLAKEHPEWILWKNGRPTNSGFNWNSFTTALDTTNPDALEYVRKVVQMAAQDWGFDYLKLDFLYAGGLGGSHKDPTKTRAQVLRTAMESIRDAAGNETFLLGCGAPIGSMPGVVDAMRIGEDVLDYWQTTLFGNKWLFRNEPNAPSAKNAIQNTLSRSMMHNKWWINDPDTLLVRQTSHLTLEEIQSLASIIALSGGMLMLSDNLPKVSKERLRIAQQLIPQMDQRPWVLDWFDRQMPSKLRLDFENATGKWHILSISNWDDHAQDIDLDLREYQIPEGSYWARSFWDQKTYQFEDKIIHLKNMEAHATSVFAVREMDKKKPQYLGSDLHISQGLEISEWNDKKGKLQIEFNLPRKAQGQFELYLPVNPKRITIDGAFVHIPQSDNGRYLLPISLQKKAKVIIDF